MVKLLFPVLNETLTMKPGYNQNADEEKSNSLQERNMNEQAYLGIGQIMSRLNSTSWVEDS